MAEIFSGLPWFSLVGAAAVATIVAGWLYRAPKSLDILGIDATHYHVPYAVNYAHGTNLFGFLATPHLYPMGMSLLAAWFLQPLTSPLLLDLTNLLPFLLLLASLLYLFNLLTDEPGWDWVPFLFLLLFTGKLFRVSLFISADLFYAASFAALFTQLIRIWVRQRVETIDWLALAFSTGMLLSSKPQGAMSAGLLFALFAAATIGGFVLRRRRLCIGLSATAGVCAPLLLFASGGVWLLRNWFHFGSPIAPAGLSVFGVTIFPGPPARSSAAALSVLADMRDIAGYDLAERFLHYSREWVGVWPVFLVPGLALLVWDIGYQSRRRRLSKSSLDKLFGLLFLSLLFALHAYILAGVTFSSLEWLRGQTLRFLLPFFALFPLVLSACIFNQATRRRGTAWLEWIVWLPGLLLLLVEYNEWTQMPEQWIRSNGTEDLLTRRVLPLAALLLLPWLWQSAAPAIRHWRRATIVVAALLLVGLAVRCVTQERLLQVDAHREFERELARFRSAGRVPNPYRGALYQAVLYQRHRRLDCDRTRFFTISRFDFPLELQGADFANEVFDVQNDSTRILGLLRTDGPGRKGRCDFVIAVHTDSDVRGTWYPAIPQTEIDRLLLLPHGIEPVGDAGLYRVYYVPGSGP